MKKALHQGIGESIEAFFGSSKLIYYLTLNKKLKIMIKFVEGTDNKVIVTSDGRVFKRYAIKKGNKPVGWSEFREVNPRNSSSGYPQVNLGRIRNAAPVHRLVAEAFIPNPLGLRDVDHIDGNKTNNRIENLRWVSHKENCNNPNTKYKSAYSGSHRIWTDIQGFNPKSNHRTPVFKDRREASAWITPEGKKINPGSLICYLNKKTTYRNYFWTAKPVTGEEYRKLLE